MNEIKMILSYVLLSIIGLGIIAIGIAATIFNLEILSLISFVSGMAICISAFFAARKLID